MDVTPILILTNLSLTGLQIRNRRGQGNAPGRHLQADAGVFHLLLCWRENLHKTDTGGSAAKADREMVRD
jgi:hypothetical protein